MFCKISFLSEKKNICYEDMLFMLYMKFILNLHYKSFNFQEMDPTSHYHREHWNSKCVYKDV